MTCAIRELHSIRGPAFLGHGFLRVSLEGFDCERSTAPRNRLRPSSPRCSWARPFSPPARGPAGGATGQSPWSRFDPNRPLGKIGHSLGLDFVAEAPPTSLASDPPWQQI